MAIKDNRQEATAEAIETAAKHADRRQTRIQAHDCDSHDMVQVPGVGEQCRTCTARSIDT